MSTQITTIMASHASSTMTAAPGCAKKSFMAHLLFRNQVQQNLDESVNAALRLLDFTSVAADSESGSERTSRKGESLQRESERWEMVSFVKGDDKNGIKSHAPIEASYSPIVISPLSQHTASHGTPEAKSRSSIRSLAEDVRSPVSSPLVLILADLHSHLISWKNVDPSRLGSLLAFEPSVSIHRRCANGSMSRKERTYQVYLFERAIIAVKGGAEDNTEGSLRLKGRVFLRSMVDLRVGNVNSRPNLQITWHDNSSSGIGQLESQDASSQQMSPRASKIRDQPAEEDKNAQFEVLDRPNPLASNPITPPPPSVPSLPSSHTTRSSSSSHDSQAQEEDDLESNDGTILPIQRPESLETDTLHFSDPFIARLWFVKLRHLLRQRGMGSVVSSSDNSGSVADPSRHEEQRQRATQRSEPKNGTNRKWRDQGMRGKGIGEWVFMLP